MDYATLRRLATFKNSNVDKKSYEGQTAVKLCNYTDVYYNDRITTELDFMEATASAAEVFQFTLKQGDVIITKDSETADDIGVPAIVAHNLPGVLCGYHLTVLRAGPDLVPEFLYYVLKSTLAERHFQNEAKGVTRMALGQNGIAQLPVPVLPPKQQRVIASLLDRETVRIDALVNAKNRLLAKMDEASILFEQAQVFGHGPGQSARVAPDGGIHSSYPTVRNRHIFREIQELSTTGEEELLTVSHKDGVRRRADKEVYMFMAETNVGYKRCQPGDLVINTMWAWMGAAGTSVYEGIVSPAYNVYRPTEDLLPEYVDTVIRTPAYVKWMECNSTGVWKSRLRLYPQYFFDLYFPLPTLEEQGDIMRRIEARRAKDAALREPILRSIELAKERRQALITHAVTGQLKIPMEAVHA